MNRVRTLTCLLLHLQFGTLTSKADSTFANSIITGTVNTPGLVEASGAAVSRSNPGVIWTHNDKGGQPEIFAIDTQGRWLGTYNLPGAQSLDYEDIAIGPGPEPGVDYIFLGDIGDKKNAERPNIVVYRIPEPAVYPNQTDSPRNTSLKGVEAITLNFPGTPQNAETLLCDPLTGDLFLVTKQDGLAQIFRITKSQLDAGGTITMGFVRQISFDSASGGDISPTGCEIAIRQESFARLWTRAHGQSIADAFAATPIVIPVVGKPTEKNGEAISFTPSGDGYYTLSDSLESQPLYYFERTSEPTAPEPMPLLARGSDWKFDDSGTEPEGIWASSTFDDSSWDSGAAEFGTGDGDEATSIGLVTASYFRKTFDIASLPAGYRLKLNLLYDDGATVYLNGQVAAVVNLPNDASHESLALTTREALEDSWLRIKLDPDLLRTASNTIAVAVHQASPNGGDISFDAQLALFEFTPTRIVGFEILPNGNLDIRVETDAASLFLQSSGDLRTWTDLAEITILENSATHEFAPPAGPVRRYFRLRQP